MKCPIARVLTMALVLGLGTGIAPAQNSTNSVPLGDLARQLKAQRAKSEGKSKVFTNDDLATLSPSGERSAASPAKSSSKTAKEAKSGEKPATKTSGNEAGKESAKAPQAETGEQTHGEAYYHEHMSKLQDRLQIDQRELSVLDKNWAKIRCNTTPIRTRVCSRKAVPPLCRIFTNCKTRSTRRKPRLPQIRRLSMTSGSNYDAKAVTRGGFVRAALGCVTLD